MVHNEILTTFQNALQLSLNTQIIGVQISGTEDKATVKVHFLKKNSEDEKLQSFLKILENSVSWITPNTLKWQNTNFKEIELITELLMLSRLDKKNLNKLAEIDPRFTPWVKNKFETHTTTESKINPTQIIFDQLEKKQIPQSDLAKKTEISLVSLYKFKNGGDIRLSNFLKMLEALNLEMEIKERK